MNKIGVNVEAPNKHGRILWDIFKDIDFDRYYFKVEDSEIILDDEERSDLFRNKYITGIEFINSIKNNCYYLIFSKISATREHDYDFEVDSYEDFSISKYKILVLIYDTVYIEVYCKDKNLLNKIINNTEEKGYQFEVLYDKPVRVNMNIW